MRVIATSNNVKFGGLKRKFQVRRLRHGFGLLEAVVAGIFIVSLSFAVAIVSVAQQNAGIVQDTETALSDELLRQSEFARSLPMAGTSAVTALMPVTHLSSENIAGIGYSDPYTPTGSLAPLPLNGYMVNSFNAQTLTPTVTWVRTRLHVNTTIPFAIDQIKVTASITRLGISLQSSTTVYRVFEDGQSSGLQ